MYSHKCRITGIATPSWLTKQLLFSFNYFKSKEKQKGKKILGPTNILLIKYHQSYMLSETEIVIEVCMTSAI